MVQEILQAMDLLINLLCDRLCITVAQLIS
jgi:hypothetical protein